MRQTPQRCRCIWSPLLGQAGNGPLCISVTNATLFYCSENTIFWYKLEVLRRFHVYNSIMSSVTTIMHRKHMTETLCTLYSLTFMWPASWCFLIIKRTRCTNYIWVPFLDPVAIKILSLGAIWNFSKGTGLSWLDIGLWGQKGPSLRPRCIGTIRARTQR